MNLPELGAYIREIGRAQLGAGHPRSLSTCPLISSFIMTKDTPKSILVVDDEEIMRDFLVDVLEEYTVTTASDGDEAIELLQKQSYDLIITDLKMPLVSGEEVVRKAVEIDSGCKVIVISGYSTLFTVTQSIENGACAFLSKPFSIQQLRAEVTRTLEGCADQSEEKRS